MKHTREPFVICVFLCGAAPCLWSQLYTGDFGLALHPPLTAKPGIPAEGTLRILKLKAQGSLSSLFSTVFIGIEMHLITK